MRWQYIVAGTAVVVVLIVMVGISRRPQPRHVVVAEEREAVVRPRPTVVAPAMHERPTTRTVAPADNKTTYLRHARALEVAPEETTIPAGRATVVVTVLDRRSDQPVAGLRLEGSRWEAVDAFGGSDSPRSLAPLGVVARADAPGILSLAGIPAPGRVWLRLGARGYESIDVGPVDLAGDGAVVRQVYFLSPRASVVGRVVEQQSRRPVAAARVWVAATDEADDSHVNTTTTAEDGRFELGDVPSGRRYLFARAPFPAPARAIDLSVLPGQRHDVGDVEISQRGAVVRGRVAQFAWKAPVELTSAPTFLEKSRLFPRATFVIGVDTAERLVAPRYYGHDEDRMHSALETMGGAGNAFLVAVRAAAYILANGAEGLAQVTRDAVLAANYVRAALEGTYTIDPSHSRIGSS